MYLREVVKTSFVLLQAEWTVAKAFPRMEELVYTHVIVHRNQPKTFYYLYTKDEAHQRLVDAPLQWTVYDAFELHEWAATPYMDAFTEANTAPTRVVVIENNRLVGFRDESTAEFRSVTRGGGGASISEATPVARQLIAEFPEKTLLNSIYSLMVSLSTNMRSSGLPLALSIGAAIDVIIEPKSGFELVETSEGSLQVTKEGDKPPQLQFKLKATALGQGKVRVLAFHQGKSLGALTLAPVVVPATDSVDTQHRSHQQSIGAMSIQQPDLALLILQDQRGGKTAFTFRLTALDASLGLFFKRFGPVELQKEPEQYFQEFFEDIEDLDIRTPHGKEIAEQRLAAKGSLLFEKLIPSDLQVLLWSLQDRIQTVQVQSEEPWIPWELCKLQGKENGRIIEGRYLCEAFAMTRWLPEIGLKPNLTLKKMAVVMPNDSGLPLAASECDYVLSLVNANRTVERIPATFLDVRAKLAEGVYDGWHFTGHGGFRSPDPNKSAMVLENNQELCPEDLSGSVSNLGLAHPLVFLNACQIGRSALSLTDIGGWAAQFLYADAGSFIGAFWSIYDTAAHNFSKELYSRLLAGLPMGQAVREARLAIRVPGDPTWLAYTVYADPTATVR